MLYLTTLVLPLLVVATQAIICTPELCQGVKQPPLNCAGEIIKGGGFCGCTDVCAGVEGDGCETSEGGTSVLLGLPPSPACSSGHECVPVKSNGLLLSRDNGVCKKIVETTTRAQSKCEQARAIRMISFVVWEGMWVAECNPDGTYKPKQCDNTGACFCVTPEEGEMIVGTKKNSKDVTC